MKAVRKSFFLFTILALVFLPGPVSAVYNLSAFYANVQMLVYSFVGGSTSYNNGYLTSGNLEPYGSGSNEGVFNSPAGIGVDATHGYIYVSDQYNNRIDRVILATGKGAGYIGNMDSASGTCVAGKQSAWCSGDTNLVNSGTGDGMFTNQNGLAIDIAGDRMYVVERITARVQKFVLSTGAFIGAIGKSTASGTCIAGKQSGWCTGGVFSSGAGDGQFDGPMGLAIDVSGDRMYIVDTNNNRIQKFILSTGAFVGIIGKSTAAGTCVAGKQTAWCTGGTFSAGATDGTFNTPFGVTLDNTGDRLYVADADNNRVQKFILSTGAFVGSIGKSTASGTCIAGKQNAWCTGGVFSSASTDGTFNSPFAVQVDVAGDRLYVSDSYNSRIEKFILSTGAFVGSIGTATATTGTCAIGKQTSWCTGGTFTYDDVHSDGSLSTPSEMSFDIAADRLYVVDGNGQIAKFVLSTGAFVGKLASYKYLISSWTKKPGYAYGMSDGYFGGGSAAIALDSVGNRVYVLDNSRNKVSQFVASTGAFVGSIGNATVAAGTCVVGKQNGWCAGSGENFSYGSGDGMMDSSLGIAVSHTLNALFVGNYETIHKFNLTTGAFIGAIGNSTASGTCIAGKQNGWCTGGNFSGTGAEGTPYSQKGIAVDEVNDRLYSFDSGQRLQKFVASTGAYLGSIGYLSGTYGTCNTGGQAHWCTGTTNFSGTSSVDGGFLNPGRLAIDAANDRFYVLDYVRIQKFVLSTGAAVGSIGYSTASGTCVAGKQNGWCTGGNFSSSSIEGAINGGGAGITVDPIGDALYVTENYGNRIQKFKLSTGAYIGYIGKVTTPGGTCTLGAQRKWCTGGSASSGYFPGEFYSPTDLVVDGAKHVLYVLTYYTLDRISW